MKDNSLISIWVVDDNSGDLIILLENLVQLGYRSKNIQTFHDLQSLAFALEKEFPDILLLDLFLPNSLGIDTYRSVMELKPKYPIISVSGIKDIETAIKTVKLGAQDFLNKDDITPETLDRMIHYSIERYENVKSLRESEEKYKSLFKSIPIGTIILNSELQILELNDQAQKFLGNKGIVGVHYGQTMDNPERIKLLESAIISSTPITFLKNFDDQSIYLEQISSKIRIGENIRYVVSLIDQTEKILREIKKNEIVHNTMDEERMRISRELHDGIGQYLIAVQLQLEILKIGNEDIKEPVEKIQEITETSIKLARSMSYNLSPPDLDQGLKSAIQTLFEQLNNVNNIKFELNVSGGENNTISKSVQYAIFRIIQEFVNNSIKYSRCTLLSCVMELESDSARIEIKDNGIGFDTKKISHGLGLRTMKERAFASEMEFNYSSQPGIGTSLILNYNEQY